MVKLEISFRRIKCVCVCVCVCACVCVCVCVCFTFMSVGKGKSLETWFTVTLNYTHTLSNSIITAHLLLTPPGPCTQTHIISMTAHTQTHTHTHTHTHVPWGHEESKMNMCLQGYLYIYLLFCSIWINVISLFLGLCAYMNNCHKTVCLNPSEHLLLSTFVNGPL